MSVNDAAMKVLYYLRITITIDAAVERCDAGYEVRRDDDGSCSRGHMRCNSSDSLQCVFTDASLLHAQGQQFCNANAPMHELNGISSLQGFKASTAQSAVFEDHFAHVDASIAVGAQGAAHVTSVGIPTGALHGGYQTLLIKCECSHWYTHSAIHQ